MSDNAWVLKGIDPTAREQAVAEAARRGLSLGDYLTDVLLQRAVVDGLNHAKPPESGKPGDVTPPQRDFALRHRLEALERRVGLAVGGLDSAMEALDGAVFGLAARVDTTEAVAADAADGLSHALTELGGALHTIRTRLTETEGGLESLGETNDAAHTNIADKLSELDERLEGTETVARGAAKAGDRLAAAQEALQRAVAEDFNDFTHETTTRLASDLEELRAAAEAAAHHADAAAAHVVRELRALRETIEAQLEDSAAETHARMQAAFADSAELNKQLADRVGAGERSERRLAEQFSARIADVEDAAQTALEETCATLRRDQTAVSAEIEHAKQDAKSDLEALRRELATALSASEERQLSVTARLRLVDSAMSATLKDVADLRETLERRIDDTRTTAIENHDALAARVSEAERHAVHSRDLAFRETHRVEACTLAALEKIVQDRAEGDSALKRELDEKANAGAANAKQLRQLIDTSAAALHNQTSGALARVQQLEQALGAPDLIASIDQGGAPASERLARLEIAFARSNVEMSVSRLREDVNALTARADAQNEQAEERHHKLELAVADMRLSQLSAPVDENALGTLDARLSGLERRQAEALETLRADIAEFLDANDCRLAALEHDEPGDDVDVAGEFNALRQRLEDRVAEMETRSVRTLEQVSETVALIGRRFSAGDDEEGTPSAKSA